MSWLPSRSRSRARSGASVIVEVVLAAAWLCCSTAAWSCAGDAPATEPAPTASGGRAREAARRPGGAHPRPGRAPRASRSACAPPRQCASCHRRSPPPRRLRRGSPSSASAARASTSATKTFFQVRLRGLIQADARAYFDTATTALPDQFLMRRVRPIIEGTVADIVDYKIVPDFGQGSALLYDAYIDLRPFRWVALRVGKFKTPFGLERLQNDANMAFMERGLPLMLVPDRDIGASLHGNRRTAPFCGSSASSTAPSTTTAPIRTATPATAKTASSASSRTRSARCASRRCATSASASPAATASSTAPPRSPASAATRRPGRTRSSRTSSTPPPSSRR